MNFRWEHFSVFWWSWGILALLIVSFVSAKKNQKRLQEALGARIAPFLTASVAPKRRRLKWILQGFVMLLMIVAWARPQAGQSKQEIRSEGVEIMLVADVSLSMLADDVRPSRLEMAKVDMSKMIDLLAGNKIGLVAFAGSAALLSPMTTDPGSLKLFIESLTVHSVSSQGTNFKSALAEAKGAFERGGNGGMEPAGITRVIVMLSDGEDHEPGAAEAAQKLADEGIRLFTIAYGTEKGAAIPERDSLGYLNGYKKDRKGQTILTMVKGDELQNLAKAGQGEFFFASPGADYLQKLQTALGNLQKTQFESQMAVQYDEKFAFFLWCALVLGCLELALGERRGSFRLWRGRFEVPPQ